MSNLKRKKKNLLLSIKFIKLELAGVDNQRGHARTAVVVGHLHAIYVRLDDARHSSDAVSHLTERRRLEMMETICLNDMLGRDVLALPTEGIADTINKEEVAILKKRHIKI